MSTKDAAADFRSASGRPPMLPGRSRTSMTSAGEPATPIIASSVKVTRVVPSHEMSASLCVQSPATMPPAPGARNVDAGGVTLSMTDRAAPVRGLAVRPPPPSGAAILLGPPSTRHGDHGSGHRHRVDAISPVCAERSSSRAGASRAGASPAPTPTSAAPVRIPLCGGGSARRRQDSLGGGALRLASDGAG